MGEKGECSLTCTNTSGFISSRSNMGGKGVMGEGQCRPNILKSRQSKDLTGYVTIPYSKYYIKAGHECTRRTHI